MNYVETYSGNGLPALMKDYGDGKISFVSNGPLEVGDTYETNRFNTTTGKSEKKVIMITEVVESRPAKGDWSGPTWAHINPVFTLAQTL